MDRSSTLIVGMLLALITPFRITAQTAPPDDVVVTGHVKAFSLKLGALRAARSAFEEDRARLAPAASLWLEVADRGTARVSELRLALMDGKRTLPLPLDGAGRFALPALPDGHWRLTANRARSGLSVRAMVLTPGTKESDRRLGDLRLQCRVMWAMEKAQSSILMAPAFAMLEAAGPCTSKRIGIYYQVARSIGQAELREGTRTLSVVVLPNRRAYRAPLYERAFSDEARVTLMPVP